MSDSRPIPLLPTNTSEPAELVTAILKRRGGGGLLKLDRMLLHSAPLCEGWNAFFGKVRDLVNKTGMQLQMHAQVRGGLSIAPRLKELIMCAVAVLNGAHYEYEHHAPLYATPFAL
jgi:hypothetical protein